MREETGTTSDWEPPLPERYRLGDSLGFGGTADVYRAHDLLLDRPVAVKIFIPHIDPLAQQRFDDEAHALARLSHPGLVSIFDVGTHRNRPYLVMRLVEGETLQSRLLTGPLPPADISLLGARLAEALAHVHGRDLVHRDIKPSNILLDADNLPYLTDFGIALLAGATRLTASNEVIGTPAYLAPEQVLGRDIGPAVDIYALGLMLLECLTGELEYPGANKVETALARLHRPPRIPTDLPVEFASLLVAMTATEPAHRPTADRCAQRLRTMHEAGTLATWQPRRKARSRSELTTGQVAETTGGTPLWWADLGRTASMRRAGLSTLSKVWRPLAAASVAAAALTVGLVMAMTPQPAAASGQEPSTAVVHRPPSTSSTTTAPRTTTSQPTVVVQHSTIAPPAKAKKKTAPKKAPIPTFPHPPRIGHGGGPGGDHHGGKGHPGPGH